MEESGSEGLDELIFERKDTAFFKVCWTVLDMVELTEIGGKLYGRGSTDDQPQHIVPPHLWFNNFLYVLVSVCFAFSVGGELSLELLLQ